MLCCPFEFCLVHKHSHFPSRRSVRNRKSLRQAHLTWRGNDEFRTWGLGGNLTNSKHLSDSHTLSFVYIQFTSMPPRKGILSFHILASSGDRKFTRLSCGRWRHEAYLCATSLVASSLCVIGIPQDIPWEGSLLLSGFYVYDWVVWILLCLFQGSMLWEEKFCFPGLFLFSLWRFDGIIVSENM